MYHSEFSNKGDSKKEIISKIDTLNNKIKIARELLLSGDLDGADYKAVKIECEDQITTLENKLFDVSSPKINIENQLKDAVNVLLNLDLLYKNGTVAIKREIIGSSLERYSNYVKAKSRLLSCWHYGIMRLKNVVSKHLKQ